MFFNEEKMPGRFVALPRLFEFQDCQALNFLSINPSSP